MKDIVIDIETLGTRPGCPVIEIGACTIDNRTGKIVSNFSRRIDCGYTFAALERGHAVDEDMVKTVEWWLGDPGRRETLRALLSGAYGGSNEPADALGAFRSWMIRVTAGHDMTDGVRIWANGPSFDTAILRAEFFCYDIELPWLCYAERCVRTALEMAGYVNGSTLWIERGPRHRALNDARHEARKLYYSGALGEVPAIIKRLHQRGTLKGGLQ